MLFSALLHAGWNALLKIGLTPFLVMVLINAAGGIVSLPLVLVTGLPNDDSLPWLLVSVALHLAYYCTLTAAYARADMGQVYPIARGSSPLLTAVFAPLFLGEPMALSGLAGIAVLGSGIAVMSWRRDSGQAGSMDRLALLFSGLTALAICGYTITDGIGARISGNAEAYAAALFVMDGASLTVFAIGSRGIAALRPLLRYALPGLAGGVMSFGAYGLVIWAMTVAPIPLVAAVRETSVLFGAAIAVLFLKEPLRANRIAAALLIVIGLILIRLQQG